MTGRGAGDPPVLRYFDCRSRGQALRFALAGSGVEFVDERLPVADLRSFRARAQEVDVGGPFASLPILAWGEHRVAQTLAIAGFLTEQLAEGEPPSDVGERAFQAMIVSVAHLDMQVPYSPVLWLSEDVPDETLREAGRRLLAHLGRKIEQLERVLSGRRGPLFGGAAPSLADFFVYESLSRGRAVFGSAFGGHLDGSSGLRALEAAIEERPGIVDLLTRRAVPFVVTGSPNERALRSRLRAFFG